MTRRLILDGDWGVDDALSTLYLASQPDVEIVAVGTVHGNTPADSAAHNAIAVLDLAGLPEVPVAVGARRPLAQEAEFSAMVHGEDGLGGAAPATVSRSPVATSGAEQLAATARMYPGECTVVATGPLTNLALALLLEPRLPELVAGVVLMGGTVDHPGNVAPLVEANIGHDPEAADLVFGAGWPLTQVGLDVTMTTWLEGEDLARIAQSDTARGRFAWAILQHYLAFYFERHGRRGCPLHDVSAAILALHPGLGTYLQAPVSVDLRSEHNRGMLVVDRRAYRDPAAGPGRPPVDLAMDVDRPELLRGFLDGLLGA
jgi:purine nucleosidase